MILNCGKFRPFAPLEMFTHTKINLKFVMATHNSNG